MITIATIYKWLGAALLFFYNLFGNYGMAILTFGLIVKLIMLPFQMKSKHSMMRTTMLTPRVKELEKKYATNKQKYQEEVARLYKDAKVNPMSGCLWTLIPFPILIILYRVVQQPLAYMLGLAEEEITTLTDLMVNLGYYTAPAGNRASYFAQMGLADKISLHFQDVISNPAVASFADKLESINFKFLGVNLSTTPPLAFWNAEGFGTGAAATMAVIGLFLIPFISAGLSVLQTKITQQMQPAQDAQAAQTAKTMNLMMPLMSIWICFSMPAAMGVYWIEQSVLGIIQEAILNRYYKGKLDAEMAEFNEAERKREEELERKRAETERLKAEGKTQVNVNTSKKRLAAAERNAEEQRRAAQRAAERAAKGLEEELPASQVGTRRYARGRAYDPNRYPQEEIGAEEPAAALPEETAEPEILPVEETPAEESKE